MKKTSLLIVNFVSGVLFVLAQNAYTPGGNGAQTASGGTAYFSANNPLVQFLSLIKNVMDKSIPILVGFAVLAFFWFLIRFIWKGSEDPGERDKMKGGMLWAILAIFVMVSVWGLVGFLSSVTGIQVGGTMHGFKLPGQQ